MHPEQRTGRTSSPVLPVVVTTPPGGQQRMQPQPPQGAFAQGPGSGSGPAHPVIPSTRHGYTSGAPSRGDVSYPRYEPPPGSVDDDNLQLRPNRRPLIIGLGIAGVGLIILLAMTLGGRDDDDTKEQPIIMDDKGSDTGSAGSDSNDVAAPIPDPRSGSAEVKVVAPATTPQTGSGSGAGSGSAEAVVEDLSVTIDIKTDPKGADVILAGKVIGTTPFKTQRAKGKGMSMITVHKARFIDVTTEIDLGDDFTSDLKLKPAEEPVTNDTKKHGTDTKKNPGTTTTTTKNPGTTTTTKNPGTTTTTTKNPGTTTTTKNPGTTTATPPKKKPDCQPPAQYNPLDDRPVCK